MVDVTTTIGTGWEAVTSHHRGLDRTGVAAVFEAYVADCLGDHPGTDWGTAPLALDVRARERAA